MASPLFFLTNLAGAWIAAMIFAASLSAASAQDTADTDSPFVKYPDTAARYLERLHQPGPLTFRQDFPGGHAAWQKAGREKLSELLGTERIAGQSNGHQPRLRFDAEPIAETGYTRQLGSIETEPGIVIPFWLLRPTTGDDNDAKRPLVICAHGHHANGWNIYAGVYESAAEREKTEAKDGAPGVQAVLRGYVALVPATRGLAVVTALPDLKKRHDNRPCRAQLIHCLLAGRTAVGERLWDIQRLLDRALVEIDGIDPQRVAMLGNSGGGVLTVYAAAMDERIKVAVPSCSFTSFTSREGFIFHCDCCLIPRAQMELGDMSDIGGLTAPRALLAVHGRKDSLHHYPDVERAMAHVRSIYAAAGAEEKFRHRWGVEGHQFYPDLMWPFIDEQLAR